MKSKLSLKTQNSKGGTPLWKPDLGYASLFIDGSESKNIIVDAFEGSGYSYKRREQTKIQIGGAGKYFTFNSFDELINHLEKTLK